MRPRDARWQALERSASGQAGAFTNEQSASAGFTEHERVHLVRTGAWRVVLPGVMRDATTPESPALLRWAAVLWSGGALLSHRSAGELWELPGVVAPRPELTVRNGRHLRHPRVAVHRTLDLPVASYVRSGLHVTSPERTIIDLAAVVDARTLTAAFDHAIRHGHASPATVSAHLERIGANGRRGARTLQRLLAEFAGEPRAESMLERKIARVLRGAGVPPFAAQHEVNVGGRRYRLDFAWPADRVALECDGRRHHSDATAFVRDRRRTSDLTAAGWRVLVATWDDLGTPAALVARVLATLALAPSPHLPARFGPNSGHGPGSGPNLGEGG